MARRRRLGSRILKAVASPLRLNILMLLYEKGSLTYTEIMSHLKLNPSRDAGRFAYHLKTLLSMNLIEPDPDSKKYLLTEIGKTVVEFADELDEDAFKKKMLVRTSRLSIENFDKNRIIESLTREAGVPIELAQKIAREAEKRLLKLGIKYVTAPLIREFVNAILVEHGLEEYRHKLTRVGLPIYDVTQLFKRLSMRSVEVEEIRNAAGNRVLEEYTLLNILPRDIADAHISGALNIQNLGQWILKVDSVMHDLRFFLKRGILWKKWVSNVKTMRPPKSFRAALTLLANLLQMSSYEISCEQCVDYFNLYLAPYIIGLSNDEIKDELKLFLHTVNLTLSTNVSLGFEAALPVYLTNCIAVGPKGKNDGVYGDYVEESQTIASLTMDCLISEMEDNPIFNPAVIIKVRPEVFSGGDAEKVIYDAHRLAVSGITYFANIFWEPLPCVSYTASGFRLGCEWREDWELDTIRTGCTGYVTINLPRAAYEAEGDRRKFFEKLLGVTEKSLRALEIKYRTITNRINESLLPFLSQKDDGDPYFRLENSASLLSFVGLSETAQSMLGKLPHESNEALEFAEETANFLSSQAKTYAKKRKIRCALSLMPDLQGARRLATLDVEKFGYSKVFTHGGEGNHYYTNVMITPQETSLTLEKTLEIESRFHEITPGGHLIKISSPDPDADADSLLALTKKIVSDYKIGLYTFDRTITFCHSCQKTFINELSKCPNCNSTNTLTHFSRQPALYSPKTT
ncbi:MAG: anaerobic ribonucleoside-triphosphate reductase [Nitrososphaerota archaeon]|nr:anaerobic ribonucleoside-triphosphate reductase [Nitrososphaerota archaeon]